jgi:hypothetical protein
LTEVDLTDDWTPVLFAPGPDGTAPDFRATYLQLARDPGSLAELYGVLPSFSVVRARFTQTARYACHGKIDSAPIATLTRPYGEDIAALIKFNNRQRTLLAATLERARQQRGLADFAPLATDRELGSLYEKWKPLDDLYQGIVAAQHHLVCEGYMMESQVDGEFTWVLGQALEQFQRRNFLIPNGRLDADTRAALALDPRELDFRFALRVLRERVVDATGLIEDGTAGAGPQPILGRMLDPEAMRSVHGHYEKIANAAPDLVGAATEAAARDLGWTTPAATAAYLASHPGGAKVALALPPPPAYHSKHMELSAEIDRGDVWYDETPVPRVAWRRPALVLYAQDGKTKRALVRWSTTIGGWSDVRVDGAIVSRWKESDVGPREWKDLYAAPTWFPTPQTPDEDLVRWVTKGKYELKKTIMGPGPQAAFGLMLLPHLRPYKAKDGSTQYADNGIGTHGSAVVTSIINGTSHGCHRLYNHTAIRLGGFLLHHRDHVAKGQQAERFRRTIHAGGSAFNAALDTRGFLYELTPPVHVEVLRGTIRSDRKVPPADSVAAGAE